MCPYISMPNLDKKWYIWWLCNYIMTFKGEYALLPENPINNSQYGVHGLHGQYDTKNRV